MCINDREAVKGNFKDWGWGLLEIDRRCVVSLGPHLAMLKK